MTSDLKAVFWTRVRVGSPDSCWPFIGATVRGYGAYRRVVVDGGRAIRRAHRVAYWLSSGELPEVVMHTCDNAICCNPSHLRGGTQAENNHDCVSKGRHANAVGLTRQRAGFCFRGHRLSESNIYRCKSGKAECVTCRKLIGAARRAKRKAAA